MKPLTNREREVMQLIAFGHSNKSAADTLGVKVGTIEKYRGAVYYKWRVTSSVAMIRIAIRTGELKLQDFLNSSMGENHHHERPDRLAPTIH